MTTQTYIDPNGEIRIKLSPQQLRKFKLKVGDVVTVQETDTAVAIVSPLSQIPEGQADETFWAMTEDLQNALATVPRQEAEKLIAEAIAASRDDANAA